MFEPVPPFDVPELEQQILRFWQENDIERRYLDRNADSNELFSFLDGPITANGPMGVHHAWGRTYKDLWQRYQTMLGKRQRYQNGFDCQGLWVEVTVERSLGFTSKRDIETYGIAEFVRKCKESVFEFAAMQTRQSQRLGYFMDWDHSYYTLSDENNYTIWNFLKTCHERGLLYQGTDSMPWCTRCGTAISDAEAAEGYQDITHRAVFVRFPLKERPNEYLLVWTTTPWTLTANAAVAVNPELTYLRVKQGNDNYYVAKGAESSIRADKEVLAELPGTSLLGWAYHGPFDDLPAVEGVEHTVIPWREVTPEEGTGLVHIAPGCGKEDFQLGKELNLATVAPLDQNGLYANSFGWLAGRNVHDVTDDIFRNLTDKGMLYRVEPYSHRYPTCWRCGTELVFRVVEEWFISMDSLREPMMQVVRQINWLPAFGLARELDWLRNMSDWMISKKRYWGLALPFWMCPNGHLQVVGGKAELFAKAISGLEHLESPHRPWLDEVRLPCAECDQIAERIPDVGNPWLDAGIVPFATLNYDSDREYWQQWFPADFITESFPGQFRNWFYSMLAMSTVLVDAPPFLNVLGYAIARDQTGREMHKSWGNLILFDEAADRTGADIMRWLFCLRNPEANINFGWDSLDEVKRNLLVFWNTYSFFVTYARLDGWNPDTSRPEIGSRPQLDRWILARLEQVNLSVRGSLDEFDAMRAARAIDSFITDLSTWYVRLNRRRFWKAESDSDKSAAYATLYECLTTLTRMIAPFMPFLAETVYQNLVVPSSGAATTSVHLTDFPDVRPDLIDEELLAAMEAAQRVVALGRAARDRAGIKVRQPLARVFVRAPNSVSTSRIESVRQIILDELNVHDLEFAGEGDDYVTYSVRPNLPALGPRYGKNVPAIRAALQTIEPARIVAETSAGHSMTIEVDGQTIELEPSDILVEARQKEGYAAMAADGFLVALDTQLTPELVAEGTAREVVRHLNDWRKEARFNIEDRIQIQYRAAPELAQAIAAHATYIAEETLSSSMSIGSGYDGDFHGKAEFAGQALEVWLRRVDPGGGNG